MSAAIDHPTARAVNSALGLNDLKLLFLLFLGFLLPSCASLGHQTKEPVIADIRVGLASFDSNSVYEVTDKVHYKENGSCIVAGKEEPCMQWGFQFRYSNATPDMPLDCSARFSEPTQLVNIYSADTEKSGSLPMPFKLQYSAGTFFHPMYFIKGRDDKGDFTTNITCRLSGKEMISFKFTVNYGE